MTDTPAVDDRSTEPERRQRTLDKYTSDETVEGSASGEFVAAVPVDDDPADGIACTSDSTTAPRTLLTDGGEDARQGSPGGVNDDRIRTYSADGTLYAYREEDEHVVVSRGHDRGDKWTTRVPATREAVVEGEQLWTIPDNWNRQFRINGAGPSVYGVYEIPETAVDVLVSIPRKDRVVDAWYGVRAVGQVDLKFDGVLDKDKLAEVVAEGEQRDDVQPGLCPALRTVEQQWHSFERTYLDDFERWSREAFALTIEDSSSTTLSGWSFNPWDLTYDVTEIVAELCDVDHDIAAAVSDMMIKADVLSAQPNVRVTVSDREALPDGYDIRALIEAGCSPEEAVDYMMTEVLDESQCSWSRTRSTEQPTIDRNVGHAERRLK